MSESCSTDRHSNTGNESRQSEYPRHRQFHFWLGWLALTVAGQALGVGILTGWRLLEREAAPWLELQSGSTPYSGLQFAVAGICAWFIHRVGHRAAAVLLPAQASYNLIFLLLSVAAGLGLWITHGWTVARGDILGDDRLLGLGSQELVLLACVATGALAGMAHAHQTAGSPPDEAL